MDGIFSESFLLFYSRIYGARRCSKCMASISSSELVMRARHLVYHIRCFSCSVCNCVLNKGDHFGIRSSAVYCRCDFKREPFKRRNYIFDMCELKIYFLRLVKCFKHNIFITTYLKSINYFIQAPLRGP